MSTKALASGLVDILTGARQLRSCCWNWWSMRMTAATFVSQVHESVEDEQLLLSLPGMPRTPWATMLKYSAQLMVLLEVDCALCELLFRASGNRAAA